MLNFEFLDSLLDDFVEYTGLPKSTVADLNSCIVATEDERKGQDYEEFLRTSECYIKELTSWHLGGIQSLKRQTIELAGSNRKGVLLDFGAGIGTRAGVYNLAGWVVLLVELNDQCLDFAKWRFEKHNLTGRFSKEILLPYWEYTVDEVLLIDVVGHLPDPEKSIEEIARCSSLGAVLHVTWDNWWPTEQGIVHRNSEFNFEEALTRHGFHKVTKEIWRKG